MEPSVSASPSKDRAEYSELMKKVMTALFYGASSFMIMVVNKTVLTKFEFPSFQVLGIGQMVATIIILYVTKKLNYISFPDLSTDTFRKIWPLPLMYLGELEILHYYTRVCTFQSLYIFKVTWYLASEELRISVFP